MIFSTEFYDKEPTHYSATEYKGLPIDAASVPHFSRSLSLIHNLYSKWCVNDVPFSTVSFNLMVKPQFAKQALECLFIKVQDVYAQHCHHKDKAIAMICSSDDDEHKGYFLVKSDVFEYHENPESGDMFARGTLVELLNECMTQVTRSFQDSIGGMFGGLARDEYDIEYNEALSEKFHDDDRAMLFQKLSYLASVRDVEIPETYLFQVRYGYNPVSSGK